MKRTVVAVKRVSKAHTVPQTPEACAVRAELRAKLYTALLINRLQRA